MPAHTEGPKEDAFIFDDFKKAVESLQIKRETRKIIAVFLNAADFDNMVSTYQLEKNNYFGYEAFTVEGRMVLKSDTLKQGFYRPVYDSGLRHQII